MDKIFAVARREFLATVRTRAFVLSVVLMPGILVGGMFGMDWVQRFGEQEKRAVRRLAVVDRSGVFFDEFARQIADFNIERPNQRLELERAAVDVGDAELIQRVRRGDLYGYIIVSDSALALDGAGCVVARKDNQLETGQRIEAMINGAIFALRCHANGLDPQQVVALRRDVPVAWIDVQTGAAASVNPAIQFMTPFVFMFLLFMGTFAIAQGLLTTVIEEKSSRVVEVLLSAVSPIQLLSGKIIGMVVVGFVLLTVWGGIGFVAAQRYHVAELVTGYRLAIAVLYFVPGFLLIASLLAAVGSACNELKDAQSMVFPLSMITIIPMIFWPYLTEHAESAASIALSYVPPITAYVMMLRVCADPQTPLWQIVTTLAVLWAGALAAVWAAAKVFRIGVLMYGKPPSLPELLRWVRYS